MEIHERQTERKKTEPTEFETQCELPKPDIRHKQLKDEKSNEPITLPREHLSDGLNCGSLVEFIEHNDIIRGVIRWMGHIGDPQKTIAGIEVVRIHVILLLVDYLTVRT